MQETNHVHLEICNNEIEELLNNTPILQHWNIHERTKNADFCLEDSTNNENILQLLIMFHADEIYICIFLQKFQFEDQWQKSGS